MQGGPGGFRGLQENLKKPGDPPRGRFSNFLKSMLQLLANLIITWSSISILKHSIEKASAQSFKSGRKIINTKNFVK